MMHAKGLKPSSNSNYNTICLKEVAKGSEKLEGVRQSPGRREGRRNGDLERTPGLSHLWKLDGRWQVISHIQCTQLDELTIRLEALHFGGFQSK